MKVHYGAARRRKKKRLFKAAKGYFLGRRTLYRTVKETVHRAWKFAYRDRRVRKRDFRKLWIIRINAATRQLGFKYSRFIEGLKAAGIEINRKMLSELAIHEPDSFAKLVEIAKAQVEKK
jgi:large subunit ribosomal protein L20